MISATKSQKLVVLEQNALEAVQSFTAAQLFQDAVSKIPGIGNSHALLAMNRMAWTSGIMALGRLVDDYHSKNQISLFSTVEHGFLDLSGVTEFKTVEALYGDFKKFRNKFYGHSVWVKQTRRLSDYRIAEGDLETLLVAACDCVSIIASSEGQTQTFCFPDEMIEAYVPSVVRVLTQR